MTAACKQCKHEKRWHDFSHHAGACSYVDCDCTRYVPQVPRAEYQRKYQRERARRLRAEWMQAHGPCALCGSWEDLEVDHIDPKTKVASVVWSWSAKRRDEELAKCRAVCQECHSKRHAAERRTPVPHGTRAGYFDRRCRCEACRNYMRAWRKQRLPKCACGRATKSKIGVCGRCQESGKQKMPYPALLEGNFDGKGLRQ